ncbi:MAG: polyprenyl synthetase family protein [Desulfuromonadales bacterium]|jgi:geranylgeranyl diphosphate synthase, type II
MDLDAYLQDRVAQIDRALEQRLPGENILPASLHQAMRYSVFAGGKRLRPILMIAACEAVGGEMQQVVAAACAMEMIHTYSLVHDDLPAMDNDDFRRGRPTNHKIFGEATAILCGDALLTEAFRLLAEEGLRQGGSADKMLQVIEVIARYAGSQGMVGGQVVDMESEGTAVDFPTLEYIHTHKTGGLILASVQVGALLGGGTEEQIKAINRFGAAAGLAFQIADDILDVTGNHIELGKSVGSDQVRGKATYPGLLGLAESREKASELCDLAVEALNPLGEAAKTLQDLARYIIRRTR